MTNFQTIPAHIALDLFDALKGANAPGKGRRGLCWEQDFGADPVAVFLQGLPAAGKSSIVSAHFAGWHIIDADAVKASHPDYDPKNPAPLHEWSKRITATMTTEALQGRCAHILDGTGTDGDKLAVRIERARGFGFVTVLLHVRCRLETSLHRNANRERVVPPAVLVEKAGQVMAAFELARPRADLAVVVHNDNGADLAHPELEAFLGGGQ